MVGEASEHVDPPVLARFLVNILLNAIEASFSSGNLPLICESPQLKDLEVLGESGECFVKWEFPESEFKLKEDLLVLVL